MKINTLKLIPILVVLFTLVSSCEKNLEVEAEKNPSLGLSPEDAIKTPQDMQNLLNSCYDNCANMMNGMFQISGDLLADDVTPPSNNDPFRMAIYKHNIDQFNSYVGSVFSQPYYTIYRANTMDLYYDYVTDLSTAERQRMEGEAAFLRALCHFELVKLFAQPAGYTADNSHLGVMLRKRAKNEAIPRSNVAQTYEMIVSDLTTAISKLPPTNGVYASQNASKALLAKVYFLSGQYALSLPLINELINNGTYTLSDSLNRFKRDEIASEIIFGFVAGDNPYENSARSGEFKAAYRSDLGIPLMGLSTDMYNLLKDTNDKRSKMVTLFNAGTPDELAASTKFNLTTFATPYLTLTDLVLMKAEILAMQGDNAGATTEITKIVNRAYYNPAPVLAAINTPSLLENIRNERRREMVCEGDRIHQLKRIGADVNRTGSGSPVYIRGVIWNCNGMVLQFPSSCGTSSLFVYNPLAVCN